MRKCYGVIAVLLLVVLVSGCTFEKGGLQLPNTTEPPAELPDGTITPETPVKPISLSDLKFEGKRINSMIVEYTNLNNNLNYGVMAGTGSLATGYYRSVIERVKFLNDKTLLPLVNSFQIKLDTAKDPSNEILSIYNQMIKNIDTDCTFLSKTISASSFSGNITDANEAFLPDHEKVSAIWQDVSSSSTSDSLSLKKSYANAALIKARFYGDAELTGYLDEAVADIEKNDSVSYSQHLLTIFYYTASVEGNDCQDLINVIIL